MAPITSLSSAPSPRTIARDCAADDPTPRLGPWRLLKLVASSHFARVYQAQPADGGPRTALYAIKVLADQEAENPAAVERFLCEAAVGRNVYHRRLVSVLSAQVQRPPFYLVMPWMEGATLAELLRQAPLPLCSALWVARQVAEGLDALNTAGWMHCDIKPANILISPQGHATLLDLGFAQRVEETITAIHRPLMGTLNHLAPELLTSILRGDIRSDIYSLGATLYESLTLRPPFTANDLADLATQHRTESPMPLRQLSPDVPQPVARLVHRMLAKEPLRRPQNPRELLNEIVPLEINAFGRRSHDIDPSLGSGS